MEATRCFTSLLKLFIWITIFLIFSCSPSRKHELEISANILCGKWSLEGGEKRVNYPEMEFCKDRTAVLYSQADTIYRFTFSPKRTPKKAKNSKIEHLFEFQVVVAVIGFSWQ